jgi:hypothetical protein
MHTETPNPVETATKIDSKKMGPNFRNDGSQLEDSPAQSRESKISGTLFGLATLKSR